MLIDMDCTQEFIDQVRSVYMCQFTYMCIDMDYTQDFVNQGRSVYICLLTGTVRFNDSDTVFYFTQVREEWATIMEIVNAKSQVGVIISFFSNVM